MIAAAGDSILDPLTTRRALHSVPQPVHSPEPRPDPMTTRTAQEQRALELAAEGKSNKQIAARMGLSEGTVRDYLSSGFTKLRVKNRVGAETRWPNQ